MKLLAYLMRHGETALSPTPEKWLQIGLTDAGRASVQSGADYLKNAIEEGHRAPDYLVSSDLARTRETAAITARTLGTAPATPIWELRAYNEDDETLNQYANRCQLALEPLLSGTRVPLIVAHRSTVSYLEKTAGPLPLRLGGKSLEEWEPDGGNERLRNGGVMAIMDSGLVVMHRPGSGHAAEPPIAVV